MKRNTRASVNKIMEQVVKEPKNERRTKEVAPKITDTKKKNVSTKGKKNWRKNIDTTEIDKKEIKNLDIKINETKVGALKNEELFTMDVVANESNKQKFRREFEEKKVKRVKKISILEERKMKRMVKNNGIVHYKNTDSSANLDHMMKIDEKVPEKTYDLWGESNQTESIFKFPNSSVITKSRISYPKIALPHPGQSYNPDKKDVQQLMDKVVENNKNINNRKIDTITFENQKDIPAVILYESSDEEDENEVKDFKISNNPAIDDGDRHTKEKRKEKRRRFLHAQRDEELQKQKQKKIEINSSIGLKKVEKGQKKNLKELEEKNLIDMNKKKEAEKLRLLGLVDE